MKVIQPEGWGSTPGYSNGILAEGRLLAIAGQVGCSAAHVFEHDAVVGQVDQALANVKAVIECAGGRPEHLASVTLYVRDVPGYKARSRELGAVWRRHFGRHYPAMALVGVADLFDEGALLEIQGFAVLPYDQEGA